VVYDTSTGSVEAESEATEDDIPDDSSTNDEPPEFFGVDGEESNLNGEVKIKSKNSDEEDIPF
jgi:hypothetical protein